MNELNMDGVSVCVHHPATVLWKDLKRYVQKSPVVFKNAAFEKKICTLCLTIEN